ncbi:hypothetical protein GCM10015535_14620 [Streptomyces gelaticus]|uniref:Uncharacterized protein n=1 Tax=Streptomyces gelaticus TaxID=285446 RepID=A0ABQ2VTS1_9ACTN|nr:hypothetical protein GCM10015535_14620 [Streptomyces gelaticus]
MGPVHTRQQEAERRSWTSSGDGLSALMAVAQLPCRAVASIPRDGPDRTFTCMSRELKDVHAQGAYSPLDQ